ncbi:MAG: hypothetical protein ACREXR_18505 [Gammaproteobacteria bacterium]
MVMAPKFEQLDQLTDEQIRDLYDRSADTTVVGLSFYLDELRRRDYERTIKATNDLARKSFWLGVINGVLALVATVAAIIALFS